MERKATDDPSTCTVAASLSNLHSPLPSSCTDLTPSPSETSGLLSLPFEILAHIVSHLPAQFVTDVLPKVCQALENVARDNTLWQLRAQKMIGPKAGFPVGSKENFDWTDACVEMEQLMTCWTGGAQHTCKEMQEEEEQKDQKQDGGAAAKQEEEVEGAGGAAQVDVYGGNERMDMEMYGVDDELGLNQEMDLRELDDEHVNDDGAVMEEEQNHRMVFDAQHPQFAVPNLQERLLDQNHERQEDLFLQQSHKSHAHLYPALECLTLPSGHIAQINSVLLLGGEGAVCATASRDWNVKLWDLQDGPSGTERHNLVGQGDFSTHRGWVWCLASQGPLLATGGFDSTLRLWDLQAGGASRGQIRTGAAVLCLSYQPDILLAGAFDKRITMYDIRAADPLVKSLSVHGNAVMCLAADDKYIFSGSKDCTIAVYDRRAGKGLKKIRLKSYLLSMSYSGSELWAGDNKGRLHSFSTHKGTLNPVSQFDVGHTALITGVHKSSGSLYTCSSDHTIKVHIPCAPPRTLCTLHHHGGVNGLSVEADVLAVAAGEFSAEIWRPRK